MIGINKLKATDFANIETTPFLIPEAEKRGIQLAALRLDRLHPVVSGNKWFKLRYYLEEASLRQLSTLITFGGAWSNHIVATAAYCAEKGIKSIGIIRGERPAVFSSSLSDAEGYGMKLFFISREDYKHKKIPVKLQDLVNNHKALLIPEGGFGAEGARGAGTIAGFFNKADFTHLFCACGTGTTMAGLINETDLPCTGISVLKGHTGLEQDIRQLLTPPNKEKTFTLFHDYHFGGYAKKTPALTGFMNSFYRSTGIPTDFVYTGKLFFAVSDLMNNNLLPANSKALVIHSGGLQGNRSLEKGTLIF